MTVFSPSTGCRVRFRLDPAILGKECTCSSIVSSMCLATPDLGLKGGIKFIHPDIVCFSSSVSPETRKEIMNLELSSENVVTVEIEICMLSGKLELRCEQWDWSSRLYVGIDSIDWTLAVKEFVRNIHQSRLLEHRAHLAEDSKRRDVLKRCLKLNPKIAEFALKRRQGSVDDAVRWIESGRAEKVYLAYLRTKEMH